MFELACTINYGPDHVTMCPVFVHRAASCIVRCRRSSEPNPRHSNTRSTGLQVHPRQECFYFGGFGRWAHATCVNKLVYTERDDKMMHRIDVISSRLSGKLRQGQVPRGPQKNFTTISKGH